MLRGDQYLPVQPLQMGTLDGVITLEERAMLIQCRRKFGLFITSVLITLRRFLRKPQPSTPRIMDIIEPFWYSPSYNPGPGPFMSLHSMRRSATIRIISISTRKRPNIYCHG